MKIHITHRRTCSRHALRSYETVTELTETSDRFLEPNSAGFRIQMGSEKEVPAQSSSAQLQGSRREVRPCDGGCPLAHWDGGKIDFGSQIGELLCKLGDFCTKKCNK